MGVFGKHVVREDDPGRVLTLESSDKPMAPLKLRLGCLSALLFPYVLILPLYWLLPGFVDTYMGVVLFLSPLALLIIIFALFPPYQLLSLALTRDEGTLRWSVGRPGLPPKRTGTIELSQIDHIVVTVTHGAVRNENVAIPLALHFHEAQVSRPVFKCRLNVEGVDKDEEVMDLLMRVARVTGLDYQRVVVRDPKKFELRITREREARSEPVPEISVRADYVADVVAPTIERAEEVVAEFDPGVRLPRGLEVAVWEPGREVLIVTRARTVKIVLTAGLLSVATLALILRFIPDTLPQLSGWNTTMGELLYDLMSDLLIHTTSDGVAWFLTKLLLPFAVVAAFVAYRLILALRYRAQFDFATGQVSLRVGFRSHHVRSGEISEVVLHREVRGGGTRADGHTNKTHYIQRVDLNLEQGGALPLVQNVATTNLDSAKRTFDLLYPFIAALAQCLRVPHRHHEGGR